MESEHHTPAASDTEGSASRKRLVKRVVRRVKRPRSTAKRGDGSAPVTPPGASTPVTPTDASTPVDLGAYAPIAAGAYAPIAAGAYAPLTTGAYAPVATTIPAMLVTPATPARPPATPIAARTAPVSPTGARTPIGSSVTPVSDPIGSWPAGDQAIMAQAIGAAMAGPPGRAPGMSSPAVPPSGSRGVHFSSGDSYRGHLEGDRMKMAPSHQKLHQRILHRCGKWGLLMSVAILLTIAAVIGVIVYCSNDEDNSHGQDV